MQRIDGDINALPINRRCSKDILSQKLLDVGQKFRARPIQCGAEDSSEEGRDGSSGCLMMLNYLVINGWII